MNKDDMVVSSFVFNATLGASFPTGVVNMPHSVPPGIWRLMKYSIAGGSGADDVLQLRVMDENGRSLTTDSLSFQDGVPNALGALNLPYDAGEHVVSATDSTAWNSTIDVFTDIPFLVDKEVHGVKFDLTGSTTPISLISNTYSGGYDIFFAGEADESKYPVGSYVRYEAKGGTLVTAVADGVTLTAVQLQNLKVYTSTESGGHLRVRFTHDGDSVAISGGNASQSWTVYAPVFALCLVFETPTRNL